jgi:hypothetical protein
MDLAAGHADAKSVVLRDAIARLTTGSAGSGG